MHLNGETGSMRRDGVAGACGSSRARVPGGSGWRWVAVALASCVLAIRGAAQIDPERRQLVQVGYNQPVEGHSPFNGYAFYYLNLPGFVRTNLTLRAAIAPVYLDSELGIRGALGEHTDLGLGLAGGGFADNYAEIRRGTWVRAESFEGHAAEGTVSVYHLFNPTPDGRPPGSLADVPLQGMLRASFRESFFSRLDDTAPGFAVPDNLPALHLRAGLRWGGREPVVTPAVALELSAWYQCQYRLDAQSYGYGGDRRIGSAAHQVFGRALLAYTFTNTAQHVEVSLTAGTTVHADRFSAYRIGGTLPMAAEFPLMLPGYYFEELSTRQFALLEGLWSVPVSHGFDVEMYGGTAYVDYVSGLEQPGSWVSGVGGGVGWTSPGGAWQVLAGYAYGIDALRDGGRGAHNVGVVLQWDLERSSLPKDERVRRWMRKLNPTSWRGFNGLFRR